MKKFSKKRIDRLKKQCYNELETEKMFYDIRRNYGKSNCTR